jgi:hypothetical protein
MKKFLLFTLTVVSSFSLQATTFFTLTGVDVNRGANVTFLNSGVLEQGFAGVILGLFEGTDVSPLFCVDLFTNIGYGTYGANPLNPRVARNEDRVAWLYLSQSNTVVNVDTGLAFQLAIWDIVHDGGDGLSTGLVSSTTFIGLTLAQINLANYYIDLSAGHSVTSGVSIYQNFDLNTGEPAQNLIGAGAPGGNVHNPEPSTLIMVLAGGALAGAGRIRRRATV